MKTRIKFKCYDQINMIDILTMHTMINNSSIMYIYIDDRNCSDSYGSDNGLHKYFNFSDETLSLLKKMNLDIDRKYIVRYSEYYNLAWVYIHKLLMNNKAFIETDQRNQWNDYDNITKNKNNLKIYLTDERNDKYMDKCNNLLYNNGWFREAFLELIMDDSHQIDYLIDGKVNSLSKLTKILNLHTPHLGIDKDLNSSKDQILRQINVDTSQYNIFDLSLENMCHLKMDIHTIVHILEEGKYYFDDIYVECIVNKTNDLWCLIDPIKIMLDKPKNIETLMISDHLYIERYDCLDKKNIRLKHAGALYIYIENNVYRGKWLKSSKKKKIKKMFEWTIGHDENMYHNVDQLIILSSNHVNYDDKILKIKDEFFVKDIKNKLLIKINKIRQT